MPTGSFHSPLALALAPAWSGVSTPSTLPPPDLLFFASPGLFSFHLRPPPALLWERALVPHAGQIGAGTWYSPSQAEE